MTIRNWFKGLMVAAVALTTACAQLEDAPQSTTQKLIDHAVYTINDFRANKELKPFAHYLAEARAVVVLPSVLKAGFFAGGEGGNGVLVARTANGGWGQPAFYTLAAASFGLQFGVQDTAIVLIIRNDGALKSIMSHQGKIGADAGASIGLFGVGMEASTTTNMGADIVAFANSNLGAYLGASLEGAVLVVRNDLNTAFYGKGATPESIIAGRSTNPRTERLRSVLSGG
jgi:lipid-binding SYLF domain-containing protein